MHLFGSRGDDPAKIPRAVVPVGTGTGKKIGQITQDIKFEDVCKNDLIDEANAFDKAKVKADAEGFALSPDYQAVDVKAIQATL